jgi:hypothetical protein
VRTGRLRPGRLRPGPLARLRASLAHAACLCRSSLANAAIQSS